MYYAMGLNIKGKKGSEYIGRRNFLKIKKRIESTLRQRAGCEELNYDVITKDKFYANSVLIANGLPSIKNLGMISDSHLIYPDGCIENVNTVNKLTQPFFIKNIILEAGEGNYLCQNVNDKIDVNGEIKSWDEFLQFLKPGKWVIQKRYFSHSSIRSINSSALNSTRIVTILTPNGPEYLCGYQGFATGDASADSWQHGSIYVGINVKNECLKETGITSPSDKRGGIFLKHPDSEIVFKDYKIPFLKEAVQLCIRAHRVFYFNFIIGWDIAITDNGPVIVEANEKPGMNVAQALDGGMRRKIVEYADGIKEEGSRR